MLPVKVTIIAWCLLFSPSFKAQFAGGLLEILNPEGIHVSVPELLGLESPTTKSETTSEAIQTTQKANTKKPEIPCNYTATIVNGKRSCKGKLIFQENFAKLSDKKWLIENRFAQDPDYEFTIYQNNPENIDTLKNRLHIRPSLTDDKYGQRYAPGREELNLGDECTGTLNTRECVLTPRAWIILPPTISGQISTKNHFSFVYGIVEIRAKFPEGDWIYPQLLLKPKSNFYGTGYNSGTISIASSPGNDGLNKNLTGGVILGNSRFGRDYGIRNKYSNNRWNRDFHLFKLEWKTDSITVSIDNEVYGTVYPPDNGFASEHKNLKLDDKVAAKWGHGSNLAPFDKEMYLLLGVGVGGLVFHDEIDKPWNNYHPKREFRFYKQQDVWKKTWNSDSELIVDYVKIWAL